MRMESLGQGLVLCSRAPGLHLGLAVSHRGYQPGHHVEPCRAMGLASMFPSLQLQPHEAHISEGDLKGAGQNVIKEGSRVQRLRDNAVCVCSRIEVWGV